MVARVNTLDLGEEKDNYSEGIEVWTSCQLRV